MQYKFRAECSQDVIKFLEIVHEKLLSFSLEKWDELPDVDFEFESDLTLDEIISILKSIDDAHVMYQTVQPKEFYTSIRNYDL